MSEDFINQVKSIFEDKAPPFLFIGSGFSRRYLGLPDFNGLLEMTCLQNMKAYEYYKLKSSSNPSEAASYISDDFYEAVWEDEKSKDFLYSIKGKCFVKSDVYKFYIADCIQRMHDLAKTNGYNLINEIEELKQVTIDGIITTNYDLFLEELFPEFRTFIGQSELIQGNPQFIGEIYKIHGSVNRPETIVVNSRDYKVFNEKNKYLVAKLLSLFIEKPIVFIGYSINDVHIQSILSDMCSCCSDNIKRIQGNLIFMNRRHQGAECCPKSLLTIGSTTIPYWRIETDDFGKVYKQINGKREVPASLFRFFREQLYEIAKSGTPVGRIRIKDVEEIDFSSAVDFFVGVGINKKIKSYEAYNRYDIVSDILLNDGDYDASELIDKNIAPYLERGAKFIPIYKYLRSIGIRSQADALASTLPEVIKKMVRYEISAYAASSSSQYGKFYDKISKKTFQGVIDATKDKKGYTLNILPMVSLPVAKRDLQVLDNYLKENFKKDTYNCTFAKVVCYYDRLKYGWD